MEKEKIDRINYLARKSRETSLTPEELKEQETLRREYIESFKASMRGQLDRIKYKD